MLEESTLEPMFLIVYMPDARDGERYAAYQRQRQRLGEVRGALCSASARSAD